MDRKYRHHTLSRARTATTKRLRPHICVNFMRERIKSAAGTEKQKIKRILLVDDEYDVNFAVKLILEQNDFKVDSFTDASEALYPRRRK